MISVLGLIKRKTDIHHTQYYNCTPSITYTSSGRGLDGILHVAKYTRSKRPKTFIYQNLGWFLEPWDSCVLNVHTLVNLTDLIAQSIEHWASILHAPVRFLDRESSSGHILASCCRQYTTLWPICRGGS